MITVARFRPANKTLAAYSAGRFLGGALVAENVFGSACSGFLHSLYVRDIAGLNPELQLWLFCKPLQASYLDDGVASIDATDIPNFVDAIEIAAADWKTYSGLGLARKQVPGIILQNANQIDMLAVTVGTPTYFQNPALEIGLGIVRD